MPDDQTQEATLRSVVASLSQSKREPRLELTVVYHPEFRRIGARSILPSIARGKTLLLGRHNPQFSLYRDGDATAEFGLDDQHISRSALHLRPTREGMLIGKWEGACRCRVNGVELTEEESFSSAQLERGVSLFLGHSVVLLLRRNTLVESQRDFEPPQIDDELLGSSAYMSDLRRQINRLAARSEDVLILGDTGSGKELVARALHSSGARTARPLVSVNMAAITPSLAPALLFGTARGAFTGSTASTAGYFQQAQNGTLFLDEVGDTPQEVQAQLLRAVQQREIQSVGGAVSKVDVRIISATDADLEDPQCGFKAALRHRLGAAEIVLLPLCEHPEDIGELAWAFVQSAYREQDKVDLLPGESSSQKVIALWAEFFHLLVRYSWPGNVRQLMNVIRQVVLMSDSSPVLSSRLERELTAASRASPLGIAECAPDESPRADPSATELDEALAATDYQVTLAAKRLGVSRQSVYRHIDHSPRLRLAADIPLPELLQVLEDCAGNLALAARTFKVSRHGLRTRMRECRSGQAADRRL